MKSSFERLAEVKAIGTRLVVELSKSPGAQRELLRKALNSAGTGKVAHHVVPLQAVKKYPDIMKKAAEGGFDMNGANNGALLDVADHIGAHPEYSKALMAEIGKIPPELSPSLTAAAVQDIADIFKAAITDGTFGPWF